MGKAGGAAAGSDEYVAPVVAASTAEVGVAESVDKTVGIMITAAAIPVAGIWAGVRARLNHAEWRAGPGESMAMGICTHERIDVLSV